MSEHAEPAPVDLSPRRSRRGERFVLRLLWVCGALSVATTLAILFVLVSEGSLFFRNVSIVDRLSVAKTSRWMAAPTPTGNAIAATRTISDRVPVRPARMPVSLQLDLRCRAAAVRHDVRRQPAQHHGSPGRPDPDHDGLHRPGDHR